MCLPLSREVLFRLYYASYFVKRFRFEDIFVAIVARKMGVEATHLRGFPFWRSYTGHGPDESLIVSHGFPDPMEMARAWHEIRADASK
jgi:hypothetical protein